MLREVVQGERLLITMSTENQVSNENLLALTAVLEHAELPLMGEVLARIERSLP